MKTERGENNEFFTSGGFSRRRSSSVGKVIIILTRAYCHFPSVPTNSVDMSQQQPSSRQQRSSVGKASAVLSSDAFDGGYGSDEDYYEEKDKGKRKRKVDSQATRKRGGGSAPTATTVTFAGVEDGAIQDLSKRLSLRADHETRPLWVASDGVILLEAFSPLYQQAYDFLVAISEPVARPKYVHKYQLTAHSLYAAVSINIDTETIITVLQRLCKTILPVEVVNFIRDCTSTFGKAKLILKDNNYYVESAYPDVLRRLLQIPKIAAARVATVTTGQTLTLPDGERPEITNEGKTHCTRM